MSSLVEDLHTISLAEIGGLRLNVTPVELAKLANEMVAAWAPTASLAGVDLRASHDSGSGMIMANIDSATMRRVLGNLLANAIRHTPAGGTITLGARSEGDQALLEVADSGSGMTPELITRAFERFEKGSDSQGSGLGLAIARDLVEAQRGTISLQSESGRGTTVTIGLPAA